VVADKLANALDVSLDYCWQGCCGYRSIPVKQDISHLATTDQNRELILCSIDGLIQRAKQGWLIRISRAHDRIAQQF
jgi:hypothetical protein